MTDIKLDPVGGSNIYLYINMIFVKISYMTFLQFCDQVSSPYLGQSPLKIINGTRALCVIKIIIETFIYKKIDEDPLKLWCS